MPNQTNSFNSALKTIYSPAFISILLINFLVITSNYMIFAIMVPYCMSWLGSNVSVASFITGVVFVGILLGRLLSEKLVKAIGIHSLLWLGVGLYFSATALYPFLHSPGRLLIIRLAVGLAIGISGSITASIATLVTPQTYYGKGMTHFVMSSITALSFGPFLSLAILPLIGFQGLFWIATFLSFCCLFLVPFVKFSKKLESRDKKRIRSCYCFDAPVLTFLIANALVFVIWGNIQAFLIPYAVVNYVYRAATAFFFIDMIVMLVSMSYIKKIADTFGACIVLYPSLGFVAIALICLWVDRNNFYILLGAVLGGLGFGNILALSYTMVLSMVPKQRYMLVSNYFFTCIESGCSIAPLLSGLVIPLVGYNDMYGISALIALVAFPLYWITMSKYKVLPTRE